MRVEGTLRPPGDKSLSHRALIVGALARGRSVISHLGTAADVASTGAVLAALGVRIWPDDCGVVVEGGGLRSPAADLDCGNSGTTARLGAGIVAGHSLRARFTGDASLSRRPMRRVAEPLRAMGARVELAGDHLPMIVEGGTLHPISWTSPVASAQVKSAILLAALGAGVSAEVVEPIQSRDHTERLLRASGVSLGAGESDGGWRVRLDEGQRVAPFTLHVAGDPSAAAFFAGLAAIAREGEIHCEDVLWNPSRIGAFHVLRRMGVTIETGPVGERRGEPVAGRVSAAPGSSLRAAAIEAGEIPALVDEIPILACVAARADGTTTVHGAGELRVKETDRIAAIVENLRALGVEAEDLGDGLAITGTDRPLRGVVRTYGDHRIAMAFGVLAAQPGNEITIDDPSCVAVSYPGFWDVLRGVVRAR